MAQLPQLFGIIPNGLPPITTPTEVPDPTSYVFTLPARPYNHLAVFILPGITLPPNTAAAVYIQLPPPQQANFKFLGAIGPGKESAIFKISGLVSPDTAPNGNSAEIDMDAPDSISSSREVILGISIESTESVAAQIAALQTPASDSKAVVLAPRGAAVPMDKEKTVQLAQKIIKNAFNFLASYSGNLQNGVEVVPLKAFEEWWKKFEGRVRSDPGFLDRDTGD